MTQEPSTRGARYGEGSARWTAIRSVIVRLLDRLPGVNRLVRRIWWLIRLSRHRWRVRKFASAHGGRVDIDRIIWIEPEKIVYASLEEFDLFDYKGAVVGGDWDRLEKKLEEMDVYLSFRDRFIHGKPWQDTIYYKGVLGVIESGSFVWGCRNRDDLDRRYEQLDNLFNKIREEGYKTQQELMKEARGGNPLLSEDEISLNIGRNGDLLFNDGAHRLVIAKLLALPGIPVKIAVRHPEWVIFRKDILAYADRRYHGRVFNPITHPDLSNIPSVCGPDRFDIVKANLAVGQGTLLDIGAHWGYFCHRFEEIGFDCCAVELDRDETHFLIKLRRAENRRFRIESESFLNQVDSEFDVVLALNDFRRYLDFAGKSSIIRNFLENVRIGEMFCHVQPVQIPARDGKVGYSEDEIITFILAHSKLSQSRVVGETAPGGKIYRLT